VDAKELPTLLLKMESQFVLGQPLNGANRRKADRLRTVSELYPEIVYAVASEDDLPSCSAREAPER
jgi:hypothetical protein